MNLAIKECLICRRPVDPGEHQNFGTVQGNTEKYKNAVSVSWKGPSCLKIPNVDPVDFQGIYTNSPVKGRPYSMLEIPKFRKLIRRLEIAGLRIRKCYE